MKKTALEQLESSGIPMIFVPTEVACSLRRQHFQALPVNDKTPWQDWGEGVKFKEQLFLKSATYQPMPAEVFADLKPGDKVKFGAWQLRKETWPQSKKMRLYQKSGDHPKLGWAQFDGPVDNVVLLRGHEPIMSLTPNEMISVRTGARRAKGDVVITGLGLGYLLWLVSHRPQVRSIKLVEIDQDVINQMMPRLEKHLKIKPEIIRGNAYHEVPKLKGDVVLFDHFDSYGWNKDDINYRNPSLTAGFKSWWVWG